MTSPNIPSDASPSGSQTPQRPLVALPKLGNRIFWKVFTIAGLILFLLIPLGMISGIITERSLRQVEVTQEISAIWGGRQTLTGPILSLPYWYTETTKDKNGLIHQETKTQTAYLLPKDYKVSSQLAPEKRSRGIYETAVYTSNSTISGNFDLSMLRNLDITPKQYMWDKATLVMGIPSVKGISKRPTLTWKGQSLEWLPGVNGTSFLNGGLHASIPLSASDGMLAPTPVSLQSKQALTFTVNLTLNGSQQMALVPIGKQNQFDMASSWASPSFMGNSLPNERTVNQDGFTARWDIPYFARNYSQVVAFGEELQGELQPSAVGVELLNPVDFYHQSERAVKYGVLFLVLTFATYFLFEVMCQHKLYSLQYILIGFSLCLFYLLLIALSEVIGFGFGYGIASIATISSISLYSKALLGKAKKHAGLIIAGLLSVLYGYLYVLLQLEDLSLLFGTLGLFIVLSTIMYVTRNIDWTRETSTSPQATASA